MGMLLTLKFFFIYWIEILAAILGILLMKSVVMGSIVIGLGMSFRIALLTGAALAQIGEFSLVLIKIGMDNGIGSYIHHQLFLAIALISMALTPGFYALARKVENWLPFMHLPSILDKGYRSTTLQDDKSPFNGHILILGMGPIGRFLTYAIKEVSLPYAIIDLNVEVVSVLRKQGEPIFFGDGSHETVLKGAGADRAKAVIISLKDRKTVTKN
jgi:CPA2 family monovalent cation:H+ antiporter-2